MADAAEEPAEQAAADAAEAADEPEAAEEVDPAEQAAAPSQNEVEMNDLINSIREKMRTNYTGESPRIKEPFGIFSMPQGGVPRNGTLSEGVDGYYNQCFWISLLDGLTRIKINDGKTLKNVIDEKVPDLLKIDVMKKVASGRKVLEENPTDSGKYIVKDAEQPPFVTDKQKNPDIWKQDKNTGNDINNDMYVYDSDGYYYINSNTNSTSIAIPIDEDNPKNVGYSKFAIENLITILSNLTNSFIQINIRRLLSDIDVKYYDDTTIEYGGLRGEAGLNVLKPNKNVDSDKKVINMIYTGDYKQGDVGHYQFIYKYSTSINGYIEYICEYFYELLNYITTSSSVLNQPDISDDVRKLYLEKMKIELYKLSNNNNTITYKQFIDSFDNDGVKQLLNGLLLVNDVSGRFNNKTYQKIERIKKIDPIIIDVDGVDGVDLDEGDKNLNVYTDKKGETKVLTPNEIEINEIYEYLNRIKDLYDSKQVTKDKIEEYFKGEGDNEAYRNYIINNDNDSISFLNALLSKISDLSDLDSLETLQGASFFIRGVFSNLLSELSELSEEPDTPPPGDTPPTVNTIDFKKYNDKIALYCLDFDKIAGLDVSKRLLKVYDERGISKSSNKYIYSKNILAQETNKALSKQADVIVETVKKLRDTDKKYSHIGLTFSANSNEFNEFKRIQKDDFTGSFEFKTRGGGQAEVLMELNKRIDDLGKFFIIPIVTMDYSKTNFLPDNKQIYDSLEYAQKFLDLDNSILLGWTNQGEINDGEYNLAIGGNVASGEQYVRARNVYKSFFQSHNEISPALTTEVHTIQKGIINDDSKLCEDNPGNLKSADIGNMFDEWFKKYKPGATRPGAPRPDSPRPGAEPTGAEPTDAEPTGATGPGAMTTTNIISGEGELDNSFKSSSAIVSKIKNLLTKDPDGLYSIFGKFDSVRKDSYGGFIDDYKLFISACAKTDSFSFFGDTSLSNSDKDNKRVGQILQGVFDNIWTKPHVLDDTPISKRNMNFFLGISQATNTALGIYQNRALFNSGMLVQGNTYGIVSNYDELGNVTIETNEFKDELYDCIEYQLKTTVGREELRKSIQSKIEIVELMLEGMKGQTDKIQQDMTTILGLVSDIEMNAKRTSELFKNESFERNEVQDISDIFSTDSMFDKGPNKSSNSKPSKKSSNSKPPNKGSDTYGTEVVVPQQPRPQQPRQQQPPQQQQRPQQQQQRPQQQQPRAQQQQR